MTSPGNPDPNNDARALANALRDTASYLNQTLNLQDVLEHILDALGKVVPHTAANIMLVDGHVARIVAWRGYERLPQFDIAHFSWSIDDVPNLLKMFITGQPIVVTDTRDSPDWIRLNTSLRIESYVSAPIIHNDVTIGFISLNSQTSGFYNRAHADRLCAFADQVAVAIENARLYERAQAELSQRNQAEDALQRAFNEMEMRVEARTAELREANEQLKLELIRRKQAEQHLVEERALLALRVEDRTAELTIANAELARSARLKDSFLASMSHELRTPLSVILQTTAALSEQTYGPLTEDQARSLQMMEERGEQLLHIINDILDLTKINAGKLSLVFDQVLIEPVCSSAMDAVNGQCHKKGIKLHLEIDPRARFVWADPRRLRQILVNLLSNAVKFTPADGEAGLTVRANPKKNLIAFTVWDSGIGISPEKIKDLFQPFIQLDDSLSRQYEGLGMGLALVYGLVRLHDGSITVDSEMGDGSRFTLTLKGALDETTAGAALARLEMDAALPAGAQDGMPNLVLQARRCLNDLRIETTGYWYEKDSINKAVEAGCELFILDLRLLTKGHDLLYVLREAIHSSDVAVIILAQGHMIDRPTLPRGITFLPYPFNTDDLRETIRVISPRGTASLIHRAAIFLDRDDLAAQPRPSILLAEDDHATAQALSDDLDGLGYQVIFAAHGVEVVERARESLPGLILLDAQIPGLDEVDLILRIRRSPQLKHTPLVVLTSVVLPNSRAQCLAAGADVFLARPFNKRDLADIIQQLLPVDNRNGGI